MTERGAALRYGLDQPAAPGLQFDPATLFWDESAGCIPHKISSQRRTLSSRSGLKA